MSEAIGIVGRSGTGKTTSLRNLKPEETFIINTDDKGLPFRGWKKNYPEFNAEKGTGNHVRTTDPVNVLKWMNFVSARLPNVKNLIIDTMNSLMTVEFMNRSKETGFQKFTDIALHAFQIVKNAKTFRDDLNVFLLFHVDEQNDGMGTTTSKIKTLGKLLDDKVVLESLLTIVLYSEVEHSDKGNKYFFRTQSSNDTCKSPMGMFNDMLIPNDLTYVIDCIKAYEEGEEVPQLKLVAN